MFPRLKETARRISESFAAAGRQVDKNKNTVHVA